MDKQDILYWAMDEVEHVKNGEKSALDVYPKLNEIKKAIDGLRKEIYDHTIDEAEKYDKREDIIREGYRISIGSRTNYKYSQDSEYQFLKEKVKNRKSLIKKATEQGQTLTDSETGETVDPVDVSYSTFPVCEWVGKEL